MLQYLHNSRHILAFIFYSQEAPTLWRNITAKRPSRSFEISRRRGQICREYFAENMIGDIAGFSREGIVVIH